ncbi:MAG TPA: histidinol-phosphate transaminase [Candidatus Prevotella stercoripullorum]|nr:histidinol-phosphate transaminase [Candidatus Prevotella stercoripullorum]
MRPLEQLVRPNILALKPYSSARDEFGGSGAKVFLDANENPYNTPFNRYPDPLQRELKQRLAAVKGVAAENIFLGNGSDEPIDLAYRCFTRPGIDNVVAIEPTYGMYKVCADINDVEYRTVLLDDTFQTTADRLLAACDKNTKLIWICSPNNPTGNNIDRQEIIKTLEGFDGIVIVDEAYSDFSGERPLRLDLRKYPNLIVLNTMSKAWGCAAIRLGMAFAQKAIVDVFNKVKYPYNVNMLTQKQAIEALKDPFEVDKWVKIILLERSRMIEAFNLLPSCKKVYPTDANFFLALFDDAQAVYDYLKENGIIVRNRTRVTLCEDCLRITIGSKSENNELLAALRLYRTQ